MVGLRKQHEQADIATMYHGQLWEYHARNLKKVPGMALEQDFNERGREGWEFVAVADGYAIFKRPVTA